MERRVEIRRVTTADGPAVRRFLEALSRDTRWQRYHTAVPRIRSWMIDAVVFADHIKHESLLALQDDEIVGIAEWARFDPNDQAADIAIVVREDCRRHGIARALLRRLARNARTHDIDTFTGTVQSMNRATMELVNNVAPEKTIAFDGATLEVRIPLQPSA